MVAHSATDHSLPLTYKIVQKSCHPPDLPLDPGHSNVPQCWGLSRPQAQMCPSTKGASTDPATPNIGPQHSLWSLPANASHLHDPPNGENSVLLKPGSLRLPFSFKTSGRSFRHVPTVLPISREKRKKKLVVSGIAKGDQARLEGVRKWCESFGEVNQITRMPNGDLHIDFRKAEVADTVCRVNARVHIAGVGSVSLSWYSGKRP
ncbi:hypothetical protein BJV77DRAFT_968989 [Russula vinacea]|nr:hypothetical protein BJV77DRAFT_968989 [Russula vinacea]